MRIPILAWIFQVIPEGISLAALVMCLGTGDLPWKRILKMGISYSIIVYLIRLFPFTPGVHVIILAAVLGALGIFLGGLEMKKSLVFSAISVAVLVLTEFIAVYIVTSLGLFDISRMNENVISRIIFGYPHIIVLLALAFIIRSNRLSLNFLFREKI